MNHVADRSVDEIGRIVLPVQIRQLLDVSTGDKVSIFVDGDEVILKRVSLS